MRWLIGMTAVNLVLGGAVLAQPSGMQMPDSPAGKAMMNGMAAMNHAMAAAPMTGNADHDFVAMMMPHHQGAIDMARVELQYGSDPDMRRLAQSIIAAQDTEIAQMQAWSAAHPPK